MTTLFEQKGNSQMELSSEYVLVTLAYQLNKQLQYKHQEICQKLRWENITLLQTRNPGNEIAELIMLIYKRQGEEGLKKVYQILDNDREEASLKLIIESPCKRLFI
jgi:hypothetical protein